MRSTREPEIEDRVKQAQIVPITAPMVCIIPSNNAACQQASVELKNYGPSTWSLEHGEKAWTRPARCDNTA